MTAPQLRLVALLAVVLGFAAWAIGLTWSVRSLRGQIEEQVGWQIATSTWERNPGRGEAAAEVREMLPAMRAKLANTPEARETLDAVEASLLAEDSQAQRQAAARLSPLIRRANAGISIHLGGRWDQVTILVFLALAFAFAAVLMTALRQQDQQVLEITERALRAAQDRLARVGVGLLVIDGDNEVQAANEVARGLAAAQDSVSSWWRALDTNMRRPGAVPCQLCEKPAAVGRCEVRDETRMGTRTVEVVFGGHAHDLEHGDHLVVLVRDITDQRRRQVLGGVADRVADTRQLSQSVARSLAGRTMRLTRGLRSLEDDRSDPRIAEAISIGEDLRDLGRSVAFLADDRDGPCDVGAACRAAARLVRPQLAPDVELTVDASDGLMAHTRPGRFTQALFTQLLRSAGACSDGNSHHISVHALKDGSQIRVDIVDDRDPEGPRSLPAPISRTQELFQTAGATFVRQDSLDRHVATIRATALS